MKCLKCKIRAVRGVYVDVKKVKKEMEHIFSIYRLCKYLSDNETLPDIETYKEICSLIEKEVQQLESREQQLIRERYLDVESEYITDQKIYRNWNISDKAYSKIREKAFIKLYPILFPEK